MASGSTRAVFNYVQSEDNNAILREVMMGERKAMLSRFKIIPNLKNLDKAGLNANNWLYARSNNKRPIKPYPEHSVFAPPDLSYLEIDCNMHLFSPGPRTTIELSKKLIPQCDLNLALLIEGEESDELPEHILGAVGIRGLDILDPGMTPWPDEV